jgi:CBS domain-containing protein
MASKIRDLMTPDPVAVEADRPVLEAAQRMREGSMGDVLVTRDGDLYGIVTDRDIVVRCVALGEDPRQTAVESVCSTELTVLAPDDDADHAVELMRERALRRLPVVERGRLVGIVTLGDLAIERDRSSALGEISAAPPNV